MDTQVSILKATEFCQNLKLSFVATARVLDISPEELAEALYADDLNHDYQEKLMLAMITAKIDKDKRAEAEAKASTKATKKTA